MIETDDIFGYGSDCNVKYKKIKKNFNYPEVILVNMACKHTFIFLNTHVERNTL